jgi:sugar/nucleoside kinase (ribokinase family)
VPRRHDVSQVVLTGVLQTSGLWSLEVLADVTWYQTRGVPVLVDGNWSEEPRGQAFFRELLHICSVAFLNAREVYALTGEVDLIRAGAYLVAKASHLTVIVKRGAQCACLIDAHGIHQRPAYAVAEVHDTNGPGDVFLAGFLTAQRLGLEVGEMLNVANRLPALASAAPSYTERLQRFHEALGLGQSSCNNNMGLGVRYFKPAMSPHVILT